MFRRPLLLLALAALLAAPGCRALSCYQCSDQTNNLADEEAGATLNLPRCADFDEDDRRFKLQECVGTQTKTCSKVTLGNGNVVRSCFGERDEGCKEIKGATECFCTGDYCNSAGLAAPALLLLVPAAMMAALFST